MTGSADAPRAVLPTAAANKNHSISTPSAGPKTAQLLDNTSVKNRGLRVGSGDASDGDTRSLRVGSGGGVAFGGAESPERVVIEKKFKIEFTVEPEFMRDLERARSLLPTKHPKRIGLEQLFGVFLKEYLDRHDPESRMKKRKQRGENKKNVISRTKRALKSTSPRVVIPTPGAGIMARRVINARDVGIAGIRVRNPTNAVTPSKPATFRRLLCFKHNQLEAEKAYGRDHMKKFYKRE